MKIVIMAGGKGTRISTLFPYIPKPLIQIKDSAGVAKPVLEWEIERLKNQGFIDIIITLSYQAQQIMEYFGDGSRFGVHIEYFIERDPLGNAGALFKMREKLGDEPFLLLNADAVFDIDFLRMVNFHRDHRNDGCLVTLFTHPNSHPDDSGLIVADEKGRVSAWLTNEDARPQWYKNRVNAGLHIIDPIVLDMTGIKQDEVGFENKIDLDRQVLKPLCGSGKMYCYDSPEYVKDMGTPERYESVCRDFQNGIVESKNLSHPQKAVFLDRDGTINRYVGFLRNIDDFELIDGVAEAVKQINSAGYLCIVVTNQPIIARGEMTVAALDEIHNKMETLLGAEGAYVDGLYYCPHHPDKGFEGELAELKIDCDCRKPKPGLLLKAAHDFNIDLRNSWMIGDSQNDVEAGLAAGCKTVLIAGSEDYGTAIMASNLKDAVEHLIRI